MIESGKFLEWADVFGNYYGTGSADTEAVLAAGEDLVLVIDVQGARKVRRLDRDTVAIFVLPPSSVVLESRLRGRNQDDEDQIVARLDLARDEVGEFSAYEYVVINEDVDLTVDRLRAIVVAERARVTHMRDEASGIIKTFRREE
jgi:guanylate kinase